MYYQNNYQPPSYNSNNMGANYYNPLQPQMDRLNLMQQNYNMQQANQFQPMQNVQNNVQQNNQFSVLPVSGIEEVKAHPTDMSGNMSYFIDNANKRIYTKQLNMMGIPEINTYTLNNEVVEQPKKQEDNSLIERLEKRINDLEMKIVNYENIFLGGMNNVQSTNVNANDSRREDESSNVNGHVRE